MNELLRLTIIIIFSYIFSILPFFLVNDIFIYMSNIPWVLLVILYIIFFRIRFFSLWLVIILGIGLDGLLGSVLGEHTFAFLCVIGFALSFSDRFVFFSGFQKTVYISICILINQLMLLLVDIVLGYSVSVKSLWLSIVISCVIWQFIPIFMGTKKENVIHEN